MLLIATIPVERRILIYLTDSNCITLYNTSDNILGKLLDPQRLYLIKTRENYLNYLR